MIEFFIKILVFLLLNFVVFGFVFNFIFKRLLASYNEGRAISHRFAEASQVKSEILNSLKTILLFSVIGTFIYYLKSVNLTMIYDNFTDKGIFYYIASFLIVHTLHDAYFYFTHLLMHRAKWLYKYHRIHHLSADPSAFAALSFHPFEAIIQGLFFILISICIPVHSSVLITFYIFESYINMWGHIGYEYWIDNLPNRWPWKLLNTPTHHILHHQNPKYNFGIYYNFWDGIMKTNNPEYSQKFEQIKLRVKKKIFQRF
jgi:lathosterol oxidase